MKLLKYLRILAPMYVTNLNLLKFIIAVICCYSFYLIDSEFGIVKAQWEFEFKSNSGYL